MWKIGDVTIENRIVVAPMAGVSNAAFRTIVKEYGAGLVVCEMISDKALLYNNPKTLEMIRIEPEEYPLSIQLFGGEAHTLVDAAKYIESHTDAAIIDINMGCPVPKIIKSNSGSKYLLNPDHIYEVVARVVDAVELPVTVKMRSGWDADYFYPIENALAAERAGAQMVAMHGRTREQHYSGKADWDILRQVREELSIPFVANGDVRTPEDAAAILEQTGAAAAMVGRAALGNPWIIKQMLHYLETGEKLPEPTPNEIMGRGIDHLERLVALKGDATAAKEFRKLSSYYLKGLPGASKYKSAIHAEEDPEQMMVLMNKCAREATERLEQRKINRRLRNKKREGANNRDRTFKQSRNTQ